MSWLKNLFIPAKSVATTMKLRHPGAYIENQTEISIQDWLKRFIPSERVGRYLSSDLSMHQVPLFWIITKQDHVNSIEMDSETFSLEGEPLVESLTTACTLLSPTGAQAERKKLYDNFNEKLEELCLKTGVKTGKWIVYLPLESVDLAFSNLSLSLASPSSTPSLQDTSAHTIKITTSPKPISLPSKSNFSSAFNSNSIKGKESGGEEMLYELTLHCTESFDKADLRKMALILKGFGVVPIGYECDANTLLSLHPNHISGIPSPRYKISDFLTEGEISEAFAVKDTIAVDNKSVGEEEGNEKKL